MHDLGTGGADGGKLDGSQVGGQGGAGGADGGVDTGAAGQAGAGGTGSCVPKSCAELGAECGSVDNGCGQPLDCGKCSKPNEKCGVGAAPNKCACVPKTCSDLGADCGKAPDGCGYDIDCGTCTNGQTCGGGGPNKCGAAPCVPTTCAKESAECGQISDKCDSTINCGACTGTGEQCGAGGVPNKCACVPTTCAQQGAQCGQAMDGCGHSLDCGTCSGANEQCTASHKCQCVPTTCAAQSAQCGEIADGCSGTLDCGTCPFPQTCGAAGTPNHCGCSSTSCSSPGTARTVCASAPSLTAAEKVVARAYWGLIGRAPERSGLNYWVNALGASVTLAKAGDAIYNSLESNHDAPATYDLRGYIEALYVNMFGKNADDDPSGVDYWVKQSGDNGWSRGTLFEAIYNAGYGTNDALMIHRQTTLYCAVRLEKKYQTTERYEDTTTVLHRVTAEPSTVDGALDDYYDLLRPGGPARSTNAWDEPYTQSYVSAHSVSKTLDGATGRHFRRLVWWNRSGDSLWAYAVTPTNYTSKSNWPAVVMAHGGGWREGMPDDLQIYATKLAALGYVVFLPAYRLTALPGYYSPAQQNDLADFVSIVKSSANALGVDQSKVAVSGLSSGGHLAMLLGSTSNYGCVAALFPPLDLSDSGLIPGMPWYVSEYLHGASAVSVSPTSVYKSSVNTRFYVQHSANDPIVPHSESVAFVSKAGSKAELDTFPGSLHARKGFEGADRTESIHGLDTFFSNTCGF